MSAGVELGAGTVQLDARILTSSSDLITNHVAVPPAIGYGTADRLTFIAATSQTTLQFLDTSLVTLSVDVLSDAVSITSLRVRQTIEVSEVAVAG